MSHQDLEHYNPITNTLDSTVKSSGVDTVYRSEPSYQYFVVEDSSEYYLCTRVNNHLAQGCELVGGVSSRNGNYIQAMVKRNFGYTFTYTKELEKAI